MNSKKRKWIFIGLPLVVVVAWLMGQYDYAALVAGKRPLFARWKMYDKDGGSVEYWGFGYTVTDTHQLLYRIDIGKPETTTYRVGPALDYWTPFVSRDSTRFIIGTNR